MKVCYIHPFSHTSSGLFVLEKTEGSSSTMGVLVEGVLIATNPYNIIF